MKYIFIIFFLLAVIIYFIFPKDYTVVNAAAPSQDTRIIVSDENGCTIYQYPYKMGGNLQPLTKVVCDK